MVKELGVKNNNNEVLLLEHLVRRKRFRRK